MRAVHETGGTPMEEVWVLECAAITRIKPKIRTEFSTYTAVRIVISSRLRISFFPSVASSQKKALGQTCGVDSMGCAWTSLFFQFLKMHCSTGKIIPNRPWYINHQGEVASHGRKTCMIDLNGYTFLILSWSGRLSILGTIWLIHNGLFPPSHTSRCH